ncbi:hypothetical protein MOO46_03995 [Apilactobacillus apisilvae]|uniref:Amino acid permease/ SLC12A domain-containing protein n=1 Tax=Apilactobacillus apisilvae TaxID=2923364 RepID=A0ABY4PF78_9LACO|nr:hypothetical protein [Apilactobacillus apisilvae]UQS84425.1 hypothetical protein MOO46_03995 [Apilactobacillus apisilvae]
MVKKTFSKELQSKHLITMSLGGVIGTGIFMSTGYSMDQLGQSLPILLVLF